MQDEDRAEWINEMRRQEVKELIADVLADAQQRATLLDDGVLAGHNGSSFYLTSPDASFLMEVGGLLQFRYIGNFRGNEANRPSTSPDDNIEGGFEFRRVELALQGHVADPAFKYLLVLATEDGTDQIEQVIAQDVRISYDLDENWTVAAGRYFAPLLREELIGGGGSLAVALSYVNNQLSIGRGEGVSLMYHDEELRGHIYFNDGAGSGGGGGVNHPFADTTDFAITARGDLRLAGDWNEWGDFTADSNRAAFLGTALHFETGESGDAVDTNDYQLLAWTVDGSYQDNGLHLYAAAAANHTDNASSADITNYGVVFQAGYLVPDSRYEPFVRAETMFFDEDLGYVEDTVKLLTFGLNYHVNSNVKLAGDIVWALDPLPVDSLNAGLLADGVKDNQIATRLQLQLKY